MSSFKEVRERWGISQKVLAIFLGTTRSAIAMAEIKPRRFPRKRQMLNELFLAFQSAKKNFLPHRELDKLTFRALEKIHRKIIRPIAKLELQCLELRNNLGEREEEIVKTDEAIENIRNAHFFIKDLTNDQRHELAMEQKILEKKLRGLKVRRANLVIRINDLEGKIAAARKSASEI